MNLVEAIRQALEDGMAADSTVLVMGEEVGALSGAFHATEGLLARFGPDRVIHGHESQTGILAAAVGMALTGLRPVVEIRSADGVLSGFPEIREELAQVSRRPEGQWIAPVVVRIAVGAAGPPPGPFPETYFVGSPGLRVVCPSTPADAYGLLRSALEASGPVIVLEPTDLYQSAVGPVPRDHRCRLDKAREVRPGARVTVICWGSMVARCESATVESGVDAHVIDARSLAPLDTDTMMASVRRTGRCLIVHEARTYCGLGAELVAQVVEGCFFHLEAPPLRLGGPDESSSPQAGPSPSVAQIAEALRALASSSA
ncbi:MAG: transketolase C-terminal domain-containing protein [Myxococcota bacterium]